MQMKPFRAVLAELGSHLDQLEFYARRHPGEDPHHTHFLIGSPVVSVWRTLEDDEIIAKVFLGEKSIKIAFMSLLARIYMVLELMFLPSPQIDSGTGVWVHRVSRRIETIFRDRAWYD